MTLSKHSIQTVKDQRHGRVFIANGRFDGESAQLQMDKAGDLVVFKRHFIGTFHLPRQPAQSDGAQVVIADSDLSKRIESG